LLTILVSQASPGANQFPLTLTANEPTNSSFLADGHDKLRVQSGAPEYAVEYSVDLPNGKPIGKKMEILPFAGFATDSLASQETAPLVNGVIAAPTAPMACRSYLGMLPRRSFRRILRPPTRFMALLGSFNTWDR